MDYMPDYILIGKRIKACRLALNLTQETLAEAAGIGIQHMSKIENGHTKLSLPCLIALANALQTTVDHLLMDSVDISKPAIIHAAESIFSDCTPSEVFVMTQTVNILKQSLRERGLSDK
ncbi:MAG: helix-turn-helix transcriptional regulator [Oscillospiraceae bacterium]|jgi:transcriptional regulator with XRE-family HTH domain|nr:helix-turn-helix transcriptional regulator [Oscillospiraceae bacterium]